MGELLITAAKAAIEKAKTVSNVSHEYLKGRFREAFIEEILFPYLPSLYRISSGKIFDSRGNQSDECDILIIDSTRIPPILQTSKKGGLFPVESVLAVIEVKSRLTSSDYLSRSGKAGIGPNAAKIDNLFHKPGIFIKNQPIDHLRIHPLYAVFAYDSNAKNKDEIERAKEKIPDYITKIHTICVVGKSTHIGYGKGEYEKIEANEDMIEVRVFISTLLNVLPTIAASRGYPKIGNYLLKQNEAEIYSF